MVRGALLCSAVLAAVWWQVAEALEFERRGGRGGVEFHIFDAGLDANGTGTGVRYFEDELGKRALYEGQFRDHKYDGFGVTYYHETGTHGAIVRNVEYEGDFHQGEKSGQGTWYRASTGSVYYRGQFRHDKINGQGEFYRQDGTLRYRGQCRDTDAHGRGVSFHPNGAVEHIGEFYFGTFQVRDSGSGSAYHENGKLRFRRFGKGKHTQYKNGQPCFTIG